MIAAATFEIWLLGYNEAYSSLLSHQLGRNPDYRLRRFSTIPLALASAQEGEQPEAIIYDCGPTPDGAVHRAVRQLRELLPQTALFLVSSQSDVSTAVELMRHGASDYLVKDATTPDRLWQLLSQTCQPRTATTQLTHKGMCPNAASLLGEHASMQRVRELISKASRFR
jgi:two-component system response regulator AtoC